MGSLTAEQKVQAVIEASGQTLEEFLSKQRTSKYELFEVMIVLGYEIIFINKHIHYYNRLPRSLDILEDFESLNWQLCKRDINQNPTYVKQLFDEIETIKKEFAAIKDGIIQKEEDRAAAAKKLEDQKEDLKIPAMGFIIQLNEFLKLAQTAGSLSNYDHLANLKTEFNRYGILTEDEYKYPYTPKEDD